MSIKRESSSFTCFDDTNDEVAQKSHRLSVFIYLFIFVRTCWERLVNTSFFSPALIVFCPHFFFFPPYDRFSKLLPIPSKLLQRRDKSCMTLLPLLSKCASLYPVSEKTSNLSRLCDFLITQPPFIFKTAWLECDGSDVIHTDGNHRTSSIFVNDPWKVFRLWSMRRR